MAVKDREEFFGNAKPHSKAKIELLKKYLIPWIRKVVLGTGMNCLICDTFAGEGIYSDGTYGSPFVMIEEALDFLHQGLKTTSIVLLAFVEADKNNYNALKTNLENRFGIAFEENRFNKIPNENMKIMISNSTHHDFIYSLSNEVDFLVPSLFFVDPFGFKGINLNEITAMINKYSSCEFIVNFMYEEFNRFKSIESISETINEFFGSNVGETIDLIDSMSAKEKRNIIINKYKENCVSKGVKYVLDFDIYKDNSYATKMILVFMSNNCNGFNVMKSAMFDLSKNIDFEYHTKDKRRVSLFADLEEEMVLEEMSQIIYNKFIGKQVYKYEILSFVREHQFIPDIKMVSLLKILSRDGKVYLIKEGKIKMNPHKFPNDSLIAFV